MQNVQRIFWLSLLIGLVIAAASPAWAQEPADIERAEVQLALHEMKLQAERMETEIHHQNRTRELEIEAREVEIELMRAEVEECVDCADEDCDEKAAGFFFFLLCLVANILMAVWVYLDNRSRDAGQGIWIIITLLSGFFGALVYAVIRLGDLGKPAPRSSAARKSSN